MGKPRDNYKTANDFRILLQPKVLKHLQAHPEVQAPLNFKISHELFEKVASKLVVSGGKMESQIIEVDLGEPVGNSGRVLTDSISVNDVCW